MRRSLVALIFGVACMALLGMTNLALYAADWSATIKQVEKSVLFMEIGCTAFVIDATRKYVLTAAHCEDEGKEIWVDRVRATVVAKDGKKDLMVLEVKHLDPSRPALQLAPANPVRGQELMAVGYGYALERMFFRMTHVADDAVMIPEIGGPFIGTDTAFVGGQSGGPVVDFDGRVVMIVQRASETVGIGVGADVIRERVGRFFAAGK